MKPEFLRAFTLAFYKGRWVKLPMFYVPAAAYDDESGELRICSIELMEGPTLPALKIRDITSAKDKIWNLVTECLDLSSLSDEELRCVCRRNGDIPIEWVKRGVRRPSRNKKSKTIRRLSTEERTVKPLSLSKYRKIRNVLREKFPQSALICEILWKINQAFQDGGVYISLEDVVRLQVEDVAPDGGKNAKNWIRFSYDGTKILVTHLPDAIWRRLCQYILEDSVFVFSTSTGAPLSAMQVNDHIKAASESIWGEKGKKVTAISFRPACDEEVLEKVKKSLIDTKAKLHLDPILEKDWKEICSKFPEIMKGRGMNSSYDPREMMNALLWRIKEELSLAKVSSSPAFREALKSQERRWKKSGVFDKIMAFLKSKSCL